MDRRSMLIDPGVSFTNTTMFANDWPLSVLEYAYLTFLNGLLFCDELMLPVECHIIGFNFQTYYKCQNY